MEIALFFGSFNPIHVGHMIIANHILEYTQVEQLWFVVSPHNPMKEKRTLLSDHHRLMLVKEAIEDNPLMRACDVEFHLQQPNYTAITLAVLKEKYPDKNFSLIMGEDNLVSLPKWYNYRYLVENYRIIVYPRCFDVPDDHAKNKVFFDNIACNIVFLSDVPMINIDASFIRSAIRKGKSVKYLLPERVYQYVEEMGFYRTDNKKWTEK